MDYFKKLALRNLAIAACPWWADFKENLKFVRHARKWRRQGFKPPFPCLLKRTIIKTEAEKFDASVLVETGTFLGDTPWFFRKLFRKIFSIEVHPGFALAAATRFSRWPHIQILEGDSAARLPEIVSAVDGRCVYWLDGHYSAGTTGRSDCDCPIWGELASIIGKNRSPFIILIDDARCFGTDPSYPSLADLQKFACERLPGCAFFVENDIIRIHPAS
ncbi:MAG: hypothetical protein WCO57_16745 [Verrucomicrobiota bacterium]